MQDFTMSCSLAASRRVATLLPEPKRTRQESEWHLPSGEVDRHKIARQAVMA
jgi:hypothetical protein